MWMPAATALWCAVAAGSLGFAGRRRATATAAVLRELAVVLVLYAAWRRLGEVSLMGTGEARARGLELWRWERRLHLPNTLTVQRWLLHAPITLRFANWYYIVAHVVPVGAFLVWLYWRHRTRFRYWRNVLAVSSLVCQVIQFVPLAPPRLYPELGFVDAGARFGPRVYDASGFADAGQLAAMPSMHVVWAVVIGFGVWRLAPRRWRWLGPAHAALTVYAVTVTAYHWLGDALAAIAIVAACDLAGTWWSRRHVGARFGAQPESQPHTSTTASVDALA